MSEITKRATFYAGRRRTLKTFHIETDGAIINIEVGLADRLGRAVTLVEVIPDDERRGGDDKGRIWTIDGSRIVRQHEGCQCHDRPTAVDPVPVTCGTCRRTWCDRCTPTPAARCPFEYDHPEKD